MPDYISTGGSWKLAPKTTVEAKVEVKVEAAPPKTEEPKKSVSKETPKVTLKPIETKKD
jgi:hypothetical protein